MYLDSIKISAGSNDLIRYIKFHQGLNLIVDETPIATGKETGNDVGKTTVLKLIDFCLGANGKIVYTDEENKKKEHLIVKDFLLKNNVTIDLVMRASLGNKGDDILHIRRNFAQSSKNKLLEINGSNYSSVDSFVARLNEILFPLHKADKPTFRQIISHNIRYKDKSINNTIKHLDSFTKDDEYEALYLFLLGCAYDSSKEKQTFRTQIEIEEKFKKRLESENTKMAYITHSGILRNKLARLEVRKEKFNLNPDFEIDLNVLNSIKWKISTTASEISKLEIRERLIEEAQAILRREVSLINSAQLRQIYEQATTMVTGIHKTFEEMLAFHNGMIDSKISFISKDMPKISERLLHEKSVLSRLRKEESELEEKISQTNSFHEFEKILGEINIIYQKLGEHKNMIDKIQETETTIQQLVSRLQEIDNFLFSEEFKINLQNQIDKFNESFGMVSQEIYGETYALKYEIKTIKDKPVYEFSTFNTNFSSGKKQGEISCFDIAMILFSRKELISGLNFLLNDKKELMHDNQIIKIADFVESNAIQLVASILKDKLPTLLNKEKYIALKLSQDSKLFKIESIVG